MNTSSVLDAISIERKRRLAGLQEPDPYAMVLWGRAIAAMHDDSERDRLTLALKFAKEIQYQHEGLASEVYFSHPLRVAALSILISGGEKADLGILAVLHNVLEVSDVTPEMLARNFGPEISRQIVRLTVNRDIEWDQTYKANYYRELIEGPQDSRTVKIIDKLDNLFLLGLNPDDEVKKKYLAEIERFIVPMTQLTLPHLEAYLLLLIADCRMTGFIESPLKLEGKS